MKKKRDLLAGAKPRICGALFTLACVSLLLLSATAAKADGTQLLNGNVPIAVTQLNLQPLGRLSNTNQLHLAIGLPLRNQAALTTLLQQIGDPTSPSFRHYLTSEQFTEMFGPTEKDYDALVAFAISQGFTVTTRHPNRALLSVTASVANIQSALHVTLRTYQHPTEARTFFAPDVEPTGPAGIPILGISGLTAAS